MRPILQGMVIASLLLPLLTRGVTANEALIRATAAVAANAKRIQV